jgi:hypothetical protein
MNILERKKQNFKVLHASGWWGVHDEGAAC